MANFENPFPTGTPVPICDPETCPPCKSTFSTDDCIVCGYPSGAYETCLSKPTPCLSGSVDCLDCESLFEDLDIEFLGGFVSGFSSRIGFGPSESTVNIDLVVAKTGCPPVSYSKLGACCLPDGSCSSLYSSQSGCNSVGGIWFNGKSCDDDPCCVKGSGCASAPSGYQGHLGYIYTFNMGSFCFRGILTNHSYTEDNSGYKYRLTLSDGRSILGGSSVLLNSSYRLPDNFKGGAISVGEELEDSVISNTCGNGYQCKDFMISGAGSVKGVKLKVALEAINNRCVTIPISNAGLRINVTKLINVVSSELRTTTSESSIIELISLAAEESGYDFIVSINNNNEFEVTPINYKRPATDKSLFAFVENLSSKDIVISKDYGQEMATSGGSNKNKRILFGSNLCYLTSVIDFPFQLYDKPSSQNINFSPICCVDGLCEVYADLPSPDLNKQLCIADGGIYYPSTFCLYGEDVSCQFGMPCTIKNNPASIGAYPPVFITPTPIPSGC